MEVDSNVTEMEQLKTEVSKLKKNFTLLIVAVFVSLTAACVSLWGVSTCIKRLTIVNTAVQYQQEDIEKLTDIILVQPLEDEDNTVVEDEESKNSIDESFISDGDSTVREEEAAE